MQGLIEIRQYINTDKIMETGTEGLGVSQNKSGTLQPVTMLLIFLIIVINQIFLISITAILLKKIKLVIRSTAKKYYYFVIFYIVSKLTLCVFLQIKIIAGIPDEFKNIESQDIEKLFDNSLTFADCAILELFMVSFEHYITLTFSVFGNKKTEKLIRIIMQGAQLVTIFTLLIPILLFNINIISYQILNIFTMSLNCICVIAFIASFFIVNFKMTGIMMEKKTSQIIKKIYALLLGVLLGRLIMSFVEVWVQVNITNGSFEDFITVIEENQNQYVVLGLCFIMYLVLILLTEGLPLILSLRQSLVMALNEVIKPPSRQASFEDSVLTQSSQQIREQLLNNLDMSQDNQESPKKGVQNSGYKKDTVESYALNKIENPNQLQIEQRLMGTREQFLAYKAKWLKNGRAFFVKRFKNISSYIIEQILNEVDYFRKFESKVINPVKVLQKSAENEVYIIERFLTQNLYKRLDNLSEKSPKERLDLALSLAKAIESFHEDTKSAHGVLNPKNIMFDENQNIFLSGFGMESLKKYLSLTSDYCNITMYTAVELFGTARQKTITKPTKQADVYSFGILLYEIMTGNFRYRSLNLQQIRNKFEKQNTRPKIPQEMKEDIKKLMRKCWQENPESRPSFPQIVSTIQTIKSSL